MTQMPTGHPTDENVNEAERLVRSHAPGGGLATAIARTLADERRKAFHEGVVEGMKLTRTLTDERRMAFNEDVAEGAEPPVLSR